MPTASPFRFPGVDGQVHYSEGLDVGYRWYDAQHVTPLFPFGYGLSYTSFRFSHLTVTPEIGRQPRLRSRQLTAGQGAAAGHGDGSRSRTRAPCAAATWPSSTSAIRRSAGEPPRQLEGLPAA